MAEENSIIGGSRYLPEELQVKILIRLRVKVLVRFELVCKTWQSLLRSRYFIQLYGVRPRLVRKNAMLTSMSSMKKIAPKLFDHGIPDLDRKIDSNELGLVVNVLGPLNNGVYCITSHVYEQFSILTGKLAFCNFSIRHMRFANPFSAVIHSLLSKIEVSRVLFGFGALAQGDDLDLDYKVIMIVVDEFEDHYSLVYSLKSGEWKMIAGIKEKLTINDPFEVCAQRFFRGCWHWMAYDVKRRTFLLSYNFSDETFKRIKGPPYRFRAINERIQSGVFVLRGSHLAVVYVTKTKTRCTGVNIWKLMEYGVQESWSKIYTLNPNCRGRFETLIGMSFRSKPRGDEEEESDDEIESICIGSSDRSTVECCKKGNKASTFPDFCSTIYWNTPGVSTYLESMERF